MVSKFNILKNLEEKIENKTSEPQENTNPLPNHHFSQSDLDNVWNIFLENVKLSDIVVYSAINTFSLTKIDENGIEIKYPSESSRDKFSKVETDFFNLFKHKTQHYTISVEYKMDFALKKEVETKKSIFDKLLEINPLLKDLDQLMKFEFN